MSTTKLESSEERFFRMSFRRKPESRVPGENRDPVFDMVPDFRPAPHGVQGFRRDDVWMPDQVRHDGLTEFMDKLKIAFPKS